MPKTTKHLTNTEVKLAKPRVKEYSLADGRGLYLHIKPNGSKLWLFNYTRPTAKKRANLGLGNYPDLPCYGKQLAWAGKNALADHYGEGHYSTQASHTERWNQFVQFLKSEGIKDAMHITIHRVKTYATHLKQLGPVHTT